MRTGGVRAGQMSLAMRKKNNSTLTSPFSSGEEAGESSDGSEDSRRARNNAHGPAGEGMPEGWGKSPPWIKQLPPRQPMEDCRPLPVWGGEETPPPPEAEPAEKNAADSMGAPEMLPGWGQGWGKRGAGYSEGGAGKALAGYGGHEEAEIFKYEDGDGGYWNKPVSQKTMKILDTSDEEEEEEGTIILSSDEGEVGM